MPWLGPGFAGARLQDSLDMNALNGCDEDHHNPRAAVFLHEAATGMRLPEAEEPDGKGLLATIGLAPGAANTTNPTGQCMYRSAITGVLAAVAEAVSGRPMPAWLADHADAAGVQGVVHAAGDRSGCPLMNGGLSLTARALARHVLWPATRCGSCAPGRGPMAVPSAQPRSCAKPSRAASRCPPRAKACAIPTR